MRLRLVVLALALASAPGCERRPKRTLRTEPWPAPSLASAVPGAALGTQRYDVEDGSVRIDLRAKSGRPEAVLTALRGSIELDPGRPERSRASLSADLLSLSVSTAGEEDPALTRRALDWLELGPDRAPAERERNRFVRLEIESLQAASPSLEPPARRGRVTAQGALTLHHFRVPVELELEVDLGPADGSRLTIRTQRPFVVSLAAHDILPRDGRGELIPNGIAELGAVVGRDARVSAEISARLAAPSRILPPNP